MKAAIVPSANSTWEVKETKTPEPGENQVLIKIHASGMCYTDVHQTHGELPGDFPRTLGHGPVGEIYEALQIAASGKVKVKTEIYSLNEISKAYERVAEGKVRFRAVIKPVN